MIEIEPLRYRHGETGLTGWLARPTGVPRGGLVLYPTIVNYNPAMERRARMFAEQGLLTLVADFYGEPVADFEASRGLAGALRADPRHYRARLRAAIDALRGLPGAERLPVLAAGYCMGGQAALEMARDGADLLGVMSYHGTLTTDLPARPGAVKARLLVCHGDADPLVPRGDVIGFWQEMGAAGANWHFHSYSGVKHGFTDPASDTRGVAAVGYDAGADRSSWASTLEFLGELLD